MSGEIATHRWDPAAPESCALVEAHWDEMGRLYGDEGPCEFLPEDVSGDGCLFLIATVDGEIAGCGGLRPLKRAVAGSAPLAEGEIKRVYVKPEYRNQGVARRIMEALQNSAIALGYTHLSLETGTLQPFAIRLYRSMGYTDGVPYGKYIDDPRSVFLTLAVNTQQPDH
jgi:putative acetyltransferase